MLRKSISALLFMSIITMSLAFFTQPAKAADYYYTWDSATPYTRMNGALILWRAEAEADIYGFTRLYTLGGIGFGTVDAWAEYYLTVTAAYSSTGVYLTYDAKGYWSTQGKVYLRIIDTTTGVTVLDQSKDIPQSPYTVARDTIGVYVISTVVGRQYRVQVVPIISALGNPFGFGGFSESDYYNDRFIRLVVFAFNAGGVLRLYPNGAGDRTELQPYPATLPNLDLPMLNWQCVNEGTQDGYASYVRTKDERVSRTDLYNLPNIYFPTDSIINSVKVAGYFRKGYSLASTMCIKIKTHGTEYSSDGFGYGFGPWTYKEYVWAVNPYTNQPWTVDEINDLQIGFRGVSIRVDTPYGGYWTYDYCTQIYAEINYTIP